MLNATSHLFGKRFLYLTDAQITGIKKVLVGPVHRHLLRKVCTLLLRKYKLKDDQSRSIYLLASHTDVLWELSRVPLYDVSGAGMRDEPLRMSAWGAIYFLDCLLFC